MPSLLSATLSDEVLSALDTEAVLAHNRSAKPEHVLQLELGPSPFEGDIDGARVVMLLGNPGFDKTSTVSDHTFTRAGWPLAGLHPDAPDGLRTWWEARLGDLIAQFDRQTVAKRIACLQVVPWASQKFSDRRLPSRALLLDAAAQCASRGAVIVVMRAEKLWLKSAAVAESPNRHRVNSWRCSYLSPGNLSDRAWNQVVGAVGAG